MKILLINPNDPLKRRYVIIPNLGLGFLAAALLEQDHEVTILDALKDNLTEIGFKKYIINNGPFDLYGISFISPFYSSVKSYAKIIKNTYPKSIIIAGGPHPTILPELTLSQIPEINFCIQGEGEEALVNLIDAIANESDLNEVQNLVWRSFSEIKINKRKFIDRPEKIPIPAWDLLKIDSYPLSPNALFTKKSKVAPISITRGCPYSCSFCKASLISGKKIRKRNLKDVHKEILLLKSQYQIEELHIMDDALCSDHEYLVSFCNLLIDENLDMSWGCPNGVKINALNEKIIRLMEKAGCYSISVGIESGNDFILSKMKKGQTSALIKEKLELIKRVSNIRVTGFFILGYPGETIETIKNTIKFSTYLPIDRANFFNYTSFPGTDAISEEKLKDSDYYDNMFLYSISENNSSITPAQMRRFLIESNLRFYLRPEIIFGLIKEIKTIDQVTGLFKRVLAIFGVTA